MSQLDDFSHFPASASSVQAGLSPSTRILRRLLNQVRHGQLNIVLPSGKSVSAQERCLALRQTLQSKAGVLCVDC